MLTQFILQGNQEGSSTSGCVSLERSWHHGRGYTRLVPITRRISSLQQVSAEKTQRFQTCPNTIEPNELLFICKALSELATLAALREGWRPTPTFLSTDPSTLVLRDKQTLPFSVLNNS
ncbi:hypothetical protein AVEN_199277-1 [Araneus ventricosus]|uniref:Uncharacterized protein n=1 Tax=Araneus ventricosus TaxID=182803 RepID=A0A4Y2TXJ7_ARAVE|nr:hypothetical protein AVEN_199277-1 [Araneus ventricosus]